MRQRDKSGGGSVCMCECMWKPENSLRCRPGHHPPLWSRVSHKVSSLRSSRCQGEYFIGEASSQLQSSYFKAVRVCARTCGYMRMGVVPMEAGAVCLLELGFQALVSHWMWGVETKRGSYRRAASALSHEDLLPCLPHPFCLG